MSRVNNIVVIGSSKRTMNYAICSECNDITNCNFNVKYIKKKGSLISLATYNTKKKLCFPIPQLNSQLLYENIEIINRITKMITKKIKNYQKKKKIIDYIILTLNQGCLLCNKLTDCNCFKPIIDNTPVPEYVRQQIRLRLAQRELLFYEEILLQAKKNILEIFPFIKIIKLKLADFNNTIYDFDDMNFLWYKTFQIDESIIRNPDGIWEIIKKN